MVSNIELESEEVSQDMEHLFEKHNVRSAEALELHKALSDPTDVF